MDIHEYEVGLHKNELDTPALCVNLDAVERMFNRMAAICKNAGISLRPHAKIYKGTPVFAWMQLQAGVIGITVSKLSEAETLAIGGIQDILIANQVVGERKIRRLVNLAAYTNVMVTVDLYQNLLMLSQAATQKEITLGVIVEVNIGNNRCGVEPNQVTLEFVKELQKLPGLKFSGIMGYEGHLAFHANHEEKIQLSVDAYKILVQTRDVLENAGIPVEIVSGGGSATYQGACKVPGLTELQAGTYIFNDTKYRDEGLAEFECALTVLTTIISRPAWSGAEDVAIIDVGRKAIELTYGFPEVKYPAGEIFSMPQEHARLRFASGTPQLTVGDQVELWVTDANGTINLYDKIYVLRGDTVEAVWELLGRGKVT